MPDETKGNSPVPPSAESKPEEAAVQPATPLSAPAKPAPAAKTETPAKPGTPAAPAKPAAPAGPTPQPWNAALPAGLKSRFGSAIREASTYLGQDYLAVDSAVVPEVLQVLRDEEQFDYCVDITAVHYPKQEQAFEVVWILYSFARNHRIRVKAQFREGAPSPSAVALWPTANWLERECYDMFGITFDGHPDLRRILLPDGWKGYPLRKDYSILQQDKDWVQENLGIESGQ
jgi:NADH-quinone oxidoreductase subunit C